MHIEDILFRKMFKKLIKTFDSLLMGHRTVGKLDFKSADNFGMLFSLYSVLQLNNGNNFEGDPILKGKINL